MDRPGAPSVSQQSETSATALHDVVVLSDLHLGRGKNPETGRYFSLEAFFYDEDLRRFCGYLCADMAERGVPLKVIFNGDVFDVLRIEPDEVGPEATRRERRFGQVMSPAAAARLVAEVLVGHPGFVDGLAQLLEAGIEVVFLPGNHDIELQWAPVQRELRRAVVERVRARAIARLGQSDVESDRVVSAADAHLHFAPWFYYEPGRLWLEHGCQYDAESCFRYPLRAALVDSPNAGEDAEVDLPLGNFFQRYLYNAFGHITFMVPSTRANFRYFKWMLANQPALLARVAKSHGPFALQLLRRLAQRTASGGWDELRRAHEAELGALAEESGLGETLRAIDGLKEVRHDVVQGVRAIGWHVLKLGSAALFIAVFVTGLWLAGFLRINEMGLGFGPKALLLLALNFFFLTGAVSAVGYALFRGPPPEPPVPLWRAARHIAQLLDVPIVSFGHTHDEAVWRIARPSGAPGWYFNTGTWIAVFTHDVLMPRERVQFTFLRVRGHEAELLQWSPGRGEPMPVILLDEEGPWSTVAAHPAAGPSV